MSRASNASISNVIFGVSGLTLSAEERDFFKEIQPTGFIFFKRNIENPAQFLQLTSACRDIAGDRPTLMLIDQEGGRVQRLTPPFWRHFPPMGSFGAMVEAHADLQGLVLEALRLNTRLLAVDLRLMGLNVNCLPLLDVPVVGSDNIIGDRAFSNQISTIVKLGQVVVKALKIEGVLPVIKHIPGHGRARVDSHQDLPIVDEPLEILEESDFKAFKPFATEALAMTAHVTYSALANSPATFSKRIIQDIIRQNIGFQGLIMSDDLSMGALQGSFSERAQKTNRAGVDLLLHCNGEMAEMQEIAKEAQILDDNQYEKLENATNKLNPEFSDRATLEQDYEAVLKQIRKSK